MICQLLRILCMFSSFSDTNCCNQANVKWTEFAGEDFVLVSTENGILEGHKANEGSYFSFLGIPYAAPPTLNNRFKAPLPAVSWSGIRKASRVVECPQNGKGDEDCLVLNVFTPSDITKRLMSVLVYVHGGAFIIGSGQTSGAKPLTRKGLVVVTINYRLGALGFLCLGIKDAPGNAGLKDQLAALRWIQKNIINFGGDPSRVTLYGMSAGAASVELLSLSAQSRGLFQKIIIESASCLNVWAVDIDPISTARSVAKLIDKQRTFYNVYDLANFYLSLPADLLSRATYDYYELLTNGTFGFVPCVEKPIPGVKTIITKAPLDLLTSESYIQCPILYVFAALEGLFLRSEEFYKLHYKSKMNNQLSDFLPADLQFKSTAEKEAVAENIRHFYFGDEYVAKTTLEEYLHFFGDSLILNSFFDSVELHAKSNLVYLLEFSYSGNIGGFESLYNGFNMAGHGDFNKYAILRKPAKSASDRLTVERVTTLVANFVKYGNPIPAPSAILLVELLPATSSALHYMIIGKELEFGSNPYKSQLMLWSSLYKEFRRHIEPVNPRF